MRSPEIREWNPQIETVLPIDGTEIAGFKAWVNCNGFQPFAPEAHTHDGFDFGAYLREDGMIVLGLPPTTSIRSVAEGKVAQVITGGVWGGYAASITIEHGAQGSGLFSQFAHVIPRVEIGQPVNKGEEIASLHIDEGDEEGRLVHLHLELVDGWGTHGTSIAGGYRAYKKRLRDPRLIDPSIYDLTADNQGFAPFNAASIVGGLGIAIAHFRTLRVGDQLWHK